LGRVVAQRLLYTGGCLGRNGGYFPLRTDPPFRNGRERMGHPGVGITGNRADRTEPPFRVGRERTGHLQKTMDARGRL
jgi:hypothetical protein